MQGEGDEFHASVVLVLEVVEDVSVEDEDGEYGSVGAEGL